MKYLITVSSLTPGSGLSRYVFSLCRLLSDAGNEVWVMTTHDDGSVSYERGELDAISKSIRLVSLGAHNKLTKYLLAEWWILNIKPDVIVNNYNAVVQYLLPIVPKKTKIVHILHNDTDDFYRVGAINGTYVTGWIAPTQSIADHFNQFTGDALSERVTVIPHGVEETGLKEKSDDRLNIVYAGVLYEHKGVKILPTIIKVLISREINISFTIVGGGILEDWLREQFANEIKDEIVKMTGVIDHDKVYDEMAKADIFLYPTHLDAFGLVIAEAMMNGAVPVVTHLPGITDNLIENGVDGFLLKQDDIDTFASTIELLYENPDMRKTMMNKTHQKATEKLSSSVMRQNYLKYLSSI